jgi:hypothetical protein
MNKPHKRNGKIACLPHDLRSEVNQWMLDGVSYSEILGRLAGRGIHSITISCLSRWYHGGFEEWRLRNEKLERLSSRSNAAIEMVRQAGKEGTLSFSDANQLYLASMVNETLAEFDSKALQQTLDENPKQFFDLAKVITSQAAEMSRREKLDLEFQKYRDAVALAKAQIASAAKQQNGLSEDTLKKIEEATKLL